MRTTWLSSLAVTSLTLSLLSAAHAEPSSLRKLPILNLEAQAYTEVPQDTVTITLQATRQSSEQAVVTQQLTEVVSHVLAEAKKQDKVKVSSGNYYVRPQHDKDGKVTGWIGQSQLLFESTDIEAASKLAATYQDQMPVANVNFSVSKKTRMQVESELMQDAAQAFQQRALAMAQALGFSSYRLKEVNLGGRGAVFKAPRAQYEMMAASAVGAAQDLPIDSGTEELSLSLSGSIYLLDKK